MNESLMLQNMYVNITVKFPGSLIQAKCMYISQFHMYVINLNKVLKQNEMIV